MEGKIFGKGMSFFSGINSKKIPKILLVSHYLPEGGAGGGVILRDLLEEYPAEKLFWAGMYGPINYKKNWRKDIPRFFCPFLSPGRFFPYWNFFDVKFFHRLFAKSYTNRLMKVVSYFKPDLVWCIAEKETIPLLLNICEVLSNLPIHISIHDDPVIENEYSPQPFKQERFGESLKKILARASSIDAVSERLLQKYSRKDQGTAVVTRGVNPKDMVPYFGSPKKLCDGISIVLGGQGQCPEPWPFDLIGGFKLFNDFLGKNSSFHAYDTTFPENIRNMYPESLVSPHLFDEALKKYHLGYICDPQNNYGRQFAATSFSTKLVTYVTHGLPFLYHGPFDSTTLDFLSRYPAGKIVDSHDPKEISKGFYWLTKNYQRARKACEEATNNEFNIFKIRANLFKLFF
jgi:hypothetical protein